MFVTEKEQEQVQGERKKVSRKKQILSLIKPPSINISWLFERRS